ncbi:MAG: tRNA pseudouridine(55) synthase TruB [Cyanobacteria bacterium P01_A01_bin.84]
MLGFVNLNKPFDWTSHDCVAKTRKLLRIKRVGHAGTLDPAATGVLPLAVGRATRLLQYLPTNKAYKATIKLGIQTTTDDLQGEIITQQKVSNLNWERVKIVLEQFIGKIEQIPPSYSAIQVDGKRLYDLARIGEKVEAPVRTVEVFGIQVLETRQLEYPELDIAIECGAGTYIRAIARDLGAALGSGGTLAALERTHSSGFELQDSITIEELSAQLEAEEFQPLSPDLPLQYLNSITLPADSAKKWCQGQRVNSQVNISGTNLSGTNTSSYLRLYHEDGHFLGITSIENEALVPKMVLEGVS